MQANINKYVGLQKHNVILIDTISVYKSFIVLITQNAIYTSSHIQIVPSSHGLCYESL